MGKMTYEEIERRIKALSGNVGLYYKNLATGECICVGSSRAFDAASLPKLPLMLVVLKLAQTGEFDLNDKISISEAQKVGGCGAIKSIPGEVTLEILAVIRLMITISDNTATNALIRLVGLERLRQEFQTMGLEETRIERLYFDSEADARGFHNYVCPEEIGRLLVQIYERSFVSREICELAEEILLGQQIRHKIPGYIGRSYKIANKTGEDTGTTHDAAIVYSPKPFVLVICSDQTDVPETERFIRQIALDIYEENV